MTPENIIQIQDQIARQSLENAAFDGWSWDVVIHSARELGHSRQELDALFPERLVSISDHVADMADRWMFDAIKNTKPEDLRVRERIRNAVLARYEALEPHKDAMSSLSSFWAMPGRQFRAGKIIWRTADRIWDWAGDTATDYNRYTKRGLLSSILVSTSITWLGDETQDLANTKAFLDRRIDDVMKIGGALGKLRRKAVA